MANNSHEASAASDRAHEATADARSSTQPKAHMAAATLHDRAAEHHRDAGNHIQAQNHEQAAARHRSHARGLASSAPHVPVAGTPGHHAALQAHATAHGTSGGATGGGGSPHDRAMAHAHAGSQHQGTQAPVQRGKKGGSFVISKSGKKRYVKK